MHDLLVSPLFQIVALGVAGIIVWHVLVNVADSIPNLTIVRSGAVAVLCDGAEAIRLAPGAIFGQIDSFDSEAKYEALTVLEAYEIDGPTFVSMLRDHPEIQNSLSRHLSVLARASSAMGQYCDRVAPMSRMGPDRDTREAEY